MRNRYEVKLVVDVDGPQTAEEIREAITAAVRVECGALSPGIATVSVEHVASAATSALGVRMANGIPYDVVGLADGGGGCLLFWQTSRGKEWLTREIGGGEAKVSWVTDEEVAAALLQAAQADGLAAAVR
jgi:hypothetical protein